jgi:hypothetical protein
MHGHGLIVIAAFTKLIIVLCLAPCDDFSPLSFESWAFDILLEHPSLCVLFLTRKEESHFFIRKE